MRLVAHQCREASNNSKLHPSICFMATLPNALQSSRRFQLFFADTEWEDSLHPFGR